MMKAFVTGATGFIGRRLVDRLCRDGVKVVALVRTQNHGLPPDVQVLYGDLLSPDSFQRGGEGCDRLYHLAALISFDPRQRDRLCRVNGQGTANILTAAKRWGVKRSVVVSSACTVGISERPDQVLDEDSPLPESLVERHPYLASKLEAERVASSMAQEQTVVIVNPTTVYGPGDWSLNSGTLVRKVARSSILPVPPGGSNVVDVDDVVEGILLAGERGHTGRRYILGGLNLSFRQIFSIIAAVVGRRPLFLPLPFWMRRPMAGTVRLVEGVIHSRFFTSQIVEDLFAFKYYSSHRAQHELGWKPQYGFAQSIERAWAFYRQAGLVYKGIEN
ncbi:MAG: NAD-dependent epimerase/dehydratase family protein [Nitrospinota bacterium]|nr:MAG: NAD-dependent epimerase/dehydratase family protein [Nitrospinota bacterium]